MSQYSQSAIRLMPGHSNSVSFMEEPSHASSASASTASAAAAAVMQTLNLLDLPYEELVYDEGDLIFQENEIPRGLYLLKSGCVKMYVHREHARGRTTTSEYVTKLISSNEIFGYKALVQNQNSKSYARAIKPSVVWLYSKDAIMQVLSQAHPIIKNLLEQVVKDIESYEQISRLHYLASVQERIAYQLVLLADRFGVQTAQGISLHLKLTRNEFAQMASTINESLSRHLTEFKNEGLIDLNGKEIIIKNRQGLIDKSNQF